MSTPGNLKLAESTTPRANSRTVAHDARSTDVSTLLGIGKSGSRMVLTLYMLVNATFTVSTLDAVKSPYPSIVAMLVVNGAAVLIVLPHKDPLPGRWTLGLLAAVLVSTALISWQLPDVGDIGRESWHIGSNTWLLFFVALRGRILVAWLGFVGLALVHVAWSVSVGRSLSGALLALQTHAGILLVATLFTKALTRTSSRINDLNIRSIELAAATASADAEHEIRRQRVEELAEFATPLLSRIAKSRTTHADDRIDYLLAEATLRDSVRARGLQIPEIVAATAEARARGVEVTLLDDRGGGLPTRTAMKLLTARITESLRNVDSGTLTIRLGPAGRAVAASIVVDSRGESRRIDLGEDGEPVLIPERTGVSED